MSRIFEALQRAEMERKAVPGPHSIDTGEESLIRDIAGVLAGEAFTDPETVVQHDWKPSLVSLPALTDRGECVEQFRSLRSQIYMLSSEKKMKTILISSGMPAEGKTFVTANLAISLARNSDCRVLLIDGDLRRPSVHTLLGAPLSPGLSEFLAGTATLAEIMQRESADTTSKSSTSPAMSNLHFIPAGDCGNSSPEIAGNHKVEELISALSPHFDWILIDSPPVLAVTDAVDLARAADAVLLVARASSTPFDVAQRAQSAFGSSRLLGFVLNAVKDPPRSRYYKNYYAKEESSRNRKQQKD